MKIDIELVGRVAALASLEFERREMELFAEQFAEIVGFVEKLREVDTSGFDVDDIHGREDNVLCEDAAAEGLSREEALRNAPERNDEFFIVPRVIGEE